MSTREISERSLIAVGTVVGMCKDIGISASRVIPDAEGGVCLIFWEDRQHKDGSHQHLVTVVCDNEGDITVAVEDRGNPEQVETFSVVTKEQQDRLLRVIQIVTNLKGE